MLTEIEEKIVERLTAKLEGPKRVAIDEAHNPTSLATPSIDVIIGGGVFAKVAIRKYKIAAAVYVIVTFKNLKDVKARRKGVYPFLEAIVGWLTGEKLGLPIEALVPKRLDNITEKEEAEEGNILFQLEFETAFAIDKLTDEELDDLVTIGLNYYLKPGDDTADVADEITLREGT